MSDPIHPTIEIYGTAPQGREELRHRGPLPWKVPEDRVLPVAWVTASIPPRIHLLNRMLKSIERQTLQPALVIVQMDNQHEGAAITRTKALDKVPEEIQRVTFMDDDDYAADDHLESLWVAAEKTGADYVYSWFTIAGCSVDPFPYFFKRPWDNRHPHQTTIVTMVDRALAQRVGFHLPVEEKTTEQGHRHGEDYEFTLGCMAEGAKIYHLPKRTWYWVVTGHNTSGRPEKWEKAWT